MEGLDQVEPLIELAQVEERLVDPVSQQAPAHRRGCPVEDAEERAAGPPVADGLRELEIAPRGWIEGHVLSGGVRG